MKKKQKIKSSLYWSIYMPLLKLSRYLFHFFPVNNHKIVMLHDFGNGFGDSPRYIAEEIIRRKLPYKIIWLVSDKQFKFPNEITPVLITRMRSVYELSTAKVIINTMKGSCNVIKKKNQYFIYTPHGQIGAKYVEGQAGNKLSKSYIEGSKWHSKMSNLFLSSSKLFTEEVRNWYWYNGEIMESGLPRNDIFFNHNQEDIVRIKNNLNIPQDVKIILYAPTFRDNGNEKAYSIDTEMLLNTLYGKTGDNWIILIRLHPCFIWFSKPAFNFSDKVVDVTLYPDMQELLLISNYLISDYSSAMFDFYLMRKPVFLFTTDIEDYQKMRGLKDWFFKVPFPFCHNNNELREIIKVFSDEEYQIKLKTFDKFYISMENGTATQKLIERICSVMK